MCADNTTYSFFNCGSFPGNLATRFADFTAFFFTLALAWIDAGQRKMRQRLAIFRQFRKLLRKCGPSHQTIYRRARD